MTVVKDYDAQILLDSLWNQSGVISCGNNTIVEFNAYAPKDPLSGKPSYTGCVNTASGQVIYYFLNQGWLPDFNLSLTAQDTYVSLCETPRRAIVITQEGGGKAGTLSFEEINDMLVFTAEPKDSSASDYTVQSEKAAKFIAALNFACGVINASDYSEISGTGAWYPDELFKRCNFKSILSSVSFSSEERTRWFAEITDDGVKKDVPTEEAFEIFIENLLDGRPVYLAIPGHAVVLDGYDSEEDKFHINYGWGDEKSGSGGSEAEGSSQSTKWYTRDEVMDLGIQSFQADLRGSCLETFTVNDNSFYGTGTFLRALEQANAMQGSNVIEFAEDMSVENAIELYYAYKMQDELLIRGCNLVVCGLLPGINQDEEDEDEDDNENQKNVQKINYLFAGTPNSRIRFENFCGTAVIQTLERRSGAVFEFTDSLQTELFFSGANFYAGKYTQDIENIEILQAFEDKKITELSMRDEKSFVISGASGDDTVKFDQGSISIGDIDLNDGFNTLILTGGSQIFGDIEGRGVNNIFIDSTANLTGALKSEAQLYFELDEINSEAIFKVTGQAEDTFEKITAVTIDATGAAEGKHILFSWDSQSDFDFDQLSFEILGEGTVAVDDNSLVFTADSESAVAPSPDDWSLSATAEGNAITLSWNGLTDAAGYAFRYAKDKEALAGSGKSVETNSTEIILNNGTWYYQVRAFDSEGNYSDWSEEAEIVVKNTEETKEDSYLANGKMENQNVNADAEFSVLSEGILDGATVDGTLILERGSVTTGTLLIDENGSVEIYSGAAFIFDISSFDEEDSQVLINNYAAICGTFQFAITVSTDQALGEYVLADNVEYWDYSLKINVTAADGLLLGSFDEDNTEFVYNDKAYNLVYSEEEKQLLLLVEEPIRTQTAENGSTRLRWDAPHGATGYVVEISAAEDFADKASFTLQRNEMNIITPPSDSYYWRVKTVGYDEEFTLGGEVGDAEIPEGPRHYVGEDSKKMTNLFVAESSGIWGKGYAARHMKAENFPEAIEDIILEGKNRYLDIFEGGASEEGADILLLSDDSNGDALFTDDIYSAFPVDDEDCPRFVYISEIYAGAGDDIIDLTSLKYEAVNHKIIIHGGDGDDVLWADSSSFLFGDAGNDSIIGSSQTDHISGGTGDDILHGGGGDDHFLYGEPDTWGHDTIHQLEGGTVNLVFLGDKNFLTDHNITSIYDEQNKILTLSHTNGSITICGLQKESITHTTSRGYDNFDKAYAAGGFDAVSSREIFNDINGGILA